MVYVMTPASQRHIPDPETSAPGLIHMKAAFAQKDREWLWEAINKSISDKWEATIDPETFWGGNEPRGKIREAIVQAAIDQLEYPDRPTSSPPESASFRRLRATLAEAPVYDSARENAPGIWIHDDHINERPFIYWASPYLVKVYACLTGVIHEHGLAGWMQARWLVYDKVSVQGVLAYYSDSTMFSGYDSTSNAKLEVWDTMDPKMA